jgi:ribonuclease VapC
MSPESREAARFKARFRIAYADCFAAALAKRHKATVLTGGPEFRQVEKEVKVLWLA